MQIPQCTSPLSHNAPFVTHGDMGVHISVTKLCSVGYLSDAQCGICEMGQKILPNLHAGLVWVSAVIVPVSCTRDQPSADATNYKIRHYSNARFC